VTELCGLCRRPLEQDFWQARAAAREFEDVTYSVCWRCLPSWSREVLDRRAVEEEWAA
jgi:hypothetical protein